MELNLFEQINRKYQRYPDDLNPTQTPIPTRLRPLKSPGHSGQGTFEAVLKQVQHENQAPSLREIAQGARLEFGHAGPSVQYIRKLLSSFDQTLALEGNYNQELTHNIGKFQEKFGLAVKDSPFWGKVGPETLEKLESEARKNVYNPELGQNILASAQRATTRSRSIGRCYAYVAKAIHQHTQPFLNGLHAYMASDYLAQSPYFKEVNYPLQALPALPAGTIVVWDKGNSRSGHISIADGQGNEVSDHIAPQMLSHYGGGGFRVFLPVTPGAD